MKRHSYTRSQTPLIDCRRRGVTYIMILGTTAMVAALGAGGLMAVRAQSRNVDSYTRTTIARQNAISAVELGIQEIASNANWRTTHKNDVNSTWYSNKAIGSGTYSLKVVNPLGELDRFPSDPVVMTATGTVTTGIEQQVVEVTVVPSITPLTCLQTAMTSNSFINLGSTTVDGMNMIVASNQANWSIWATGPVYTHLEAVSNIISYQSLGGTPVEGVPARTMPNTSTVFDYYIAKGTAISVSSIPLVSGKRTIDKVLISPTSNPYGSGTVDAQGIYVIDCGGQSITISRSRIVGTLVLLNPGVDSWTTNEVFMEPAVSNYPTLLVDGSFEFQTNSSVLSEATANKNFNPTGTPYPYSAGSTDSDKTDFYPNQITGLVYLSGNCTTGSTCKVGMLMVEGTVASSSTLTFGYDPTFYNNPPPGFYTMKMIPSPGTWRQITY